MQSLINLLIVPYGIETTLRPCYLTAHRLLIVPYGIETRGYRTSYHRCRLLIVPYGIETRFTTLQMEGAYHF